MNEQHRWIYFTYTKGRIGVRIEPNDPDRVDAIKSLIPEEDRFYRREAREWCINPRWCSTILDIIQHYCAGYQIILEEANADLLETLLIGPEKLLQPTITAPKGREIGAVELLKNRESER